MSRYSGGEREPEDAALPQRHRLLVPVPPERRRRARARGRGVGKREMAAVKVGARATYGFLSGASGTAAASASRRRSACAGRAARAGAPAWAAWPRAGRRWPRCGRRGSLLDGLAVNLCAPSRFPALRLSRSLSRFLSHSLSRSTSPGSAARPRHLRRPGPPDTAVALIVWPAPVVCNRFSPPTLASKAHSHARLPGNS